MLYYGNQGTLCFYYKGLLISSFSLSKREPFERYMNQGEAIIKASKGIPIKTQLTAYTHFCNMIYNRKKNNQPIRRSDHIHFLNCITALLRLRIIENDELNGYMVFKKKKKITSSHLS